MLVLSLFKNLALKSHYFKPTRLKSKIDRENFFTLLQFLVFVQQLDFEVGCLGSTYFRRTVFKVQDFLQYKEVTKNYYQLKKILSFFNLINFLTIIYECK